MILKFKVMVCLEDRPCSGRLSRSANAAQTVQEEMETVVGSSTHGEVSACEVTRCTGILYTTVWITLQHTLLCYPHKIQCHHELLPRYFVKLRAFAVWTFQKMAEDENWLSNELWTDKVHFILQGFVNSHNCRIWAIENPRTYVQTPLHS